MDSGRKQFSELVPGDWKFQIPAYQRDYSWDDSQLKDLWRDLKTVCGTTKPHFMGTVLLREAKLEEESRRGRKTYDVIDGQQRLTTLSILIDTLARELQTADSKEAKYIRAQYIVNRDFKLTLKGDDAQFFKNQILGGREASAEASISPDGDAQERLKDAKTFFEAQFREKRNSLSKEAYVDYLFDLLQTIKELEFMAYKVSSASEAVRIFEATNDRGKQLTDLERTKSFLMYHLHLCYDEDAPELEDDLEEIRYAFNSMYEDHTTAAKHGSVPGLDRIQRYHFIVWDDQSIFVQNPPYTDHLAEVKQRFRTMPNTDEKVGKILYYVRELRESFEAVQEIKEGSADDTEVVSRLQRLFALNYEANFYPLLIAAWTRFKQSDIEADEISMLLDRIETYTFRAYVIKNHRTNKRKKHFYQVGRKLHAGDISIVKAIETIESYIDNECTDDKIRNELKDENIYSDFTGQRLRYLLYFYDVGLSQRDEHLQLNFEEVVTQKLENQEISIEHIWPQNPDRLNLSEEELEGHSANKHRLGNLALMISAENSAQSNKPFTEKRGWYDSSRIFMLNEIADPEKRVVWGDPEWDSDEWGPEQIESRERKLIEFVLDRWPNYAAGVDGTD